MKRTWIILGSIIGVIALIAITLGGSYNNLVGQRENVSKSFSNVQTQYQRRADLIPNLVNTVKGSANFEQETLTQVIEARSRATSVQIDPSRATPQQLQQFQSAQGELSQALGRLLVVTENYPQLRSTEAFRDLQSQLEGTENRITVARKDYNDAAATYNANVQRFPTVIAARVFNFDAFPYFQADQGAQQAPTVNFDQ
jgi:LemA protein